MTRLYGLTTILGREHVVAFGRKCFVWNIYMAKVPRRRLKGYWFVADSSRIVFNMKYNSGGKFRFFGYVSIDEDDLRDD